MQAAKELDDVKVALEQSQEKAKVSLAQDLDGLTSRARKGEERQVCLAKQFEQLTEHFNRDRDQHQKTTDMNRSENLKDLQQLSQSWAKRFTAIDVLLAGFEAKTSFMKLRK